ncbi:MAG: helix-turn-helix domain-containing protein [Spirochaetales bacterium]|nr:helix-turn-helix domain-containing protein [Spirochaetales bacterium]
MSHDTNDDREALKELSATLARVDDPSLIQAFFECLLTPSEIHEMASRWALVKLIDEGWSQRAIAQELGLSLCKITRGSRELKKENSAFARMIEIHRHFSSS